MEKNLSIETLMKIQEKIQQKILYKATNIYKDKYEEAIKK